VHDVFDPRNIQLLQFEIDVATFMPIPMLYCVMEFVKTGNIVLPWLLFPIKLVKIFAPIPMLYKSKYVDEKRLYPKAYV
jgi:hypothetical protein